jgi:hypothetical protein
MCEQWRTGTAKWLLQVSTALLVFASLELVPTFACQTTANKLDFADLQMKTESVSLLNLHVASPLRLS